jgi:hypothetical protein
MMAAMIWRIQEMMFWFLDREGEAAARDGMDTRDSFG